MVSPLDFQAPYSEESEQATLGAILVNPNIYHTIREILKPEDFYLLRHNYIFSAMDEIIERKDKLDYLTVSERLREKDLLEEIGGLPYLTLLAQSVPTSVHCEIYAKLVERTATRRALLKASDEIKALALDESIDIEQVFTDTAVKIEAVISPSHDRKISKLDEVADSYYDEMSKSMLSEKLNSIPTGLIDLDNLLNGGMNKTDLFVVCARPGMGKTSFGSHMALQAGMKQGKNVLIFSLEMTKEQQFYRMLGINQSIPVYKLRPGNVKHENALMTQAEYERYLDGKLYLRQAPIFIDDTPAIDNKTMYLRAKRLHAKYPLGLIIVDYVGLMKSARVKDSSNRQAQLADITRSLKTLAKDLDVPVLALTQVNRAVEQRQNKRPTLSDIKDSGTYEEDADLVVFLYRESYYDESAIDDNSCEFIVAKHRNGATGTATVIFDKETTGFLNATRKIVYLQGD